MPCPKTPQVLSVPDSLLSLRAMMAGVSDTLKEIQRRIDGLKSLDDDLKAVAGAAPARLVARVPKSVVSPELTDAGFAKALSEALSVSDPLSRMYGASLVVKALHEGLEDLDAKRIKVKTRAQDTAKAGSDGELSAAKALSLRLVEAKAALMRKLAYALKVWAEARKKALAAVVEVDGAMAKCWPDGAVALRKATLEANASGEIEAIAASDAFMRRGEKTATKRRVKI